MRVVSLLPGATEMVHFAGATETLAGVTHECDHPPAVNQLPKLTSTSIDQDQMTSAEIDEAVGRLSAEDSIYDLDAELLTKLVPDLIITQGLCDVCAVSPALVERAVADLETKPEVLTLNPTSLRDVLDDAVRVGNALGRGDETREKVAALETRLTRVQEAVAGRERPRVAPIEWLDPPFSAGHWVPEMVRLAGGEPLFAGPGDPSARLTWDEVLEADPDLLVLMPCGFDVGRTVREAGPLTELPGWRGVPAVRSGRVWAVDANSYFSRPAPRLADGVEILARILHPEAFADGPDAADALRLSTAVAGAR